MYCPTFLISVINLISCVGINSVFIMLTLELEIFSSDMVSREKCFVEKGKTLKIKSVK